eukprot:g33254.t1
MLRCLLQSARNLPNVEKKDRHSDPVVTLSFKGKDRKCQRANPGSRTIAPGAGVSVGALVEPKLGVTEQVIAERMLLDSTVDDTFFGFLVDFVQDI